MMANFSFQISDLISISDYDKDIIFHATNIDNKHYKVAWESEKLPMERAVSYHIDDVLLAIETGAWINIQIKV